MLTEGKTPCFSPSSAGCVLVRSHVQGWGNAVLGEVIEGKSAVDAIAAVSTGTKNGRADALDEDVVIQHAEIIG